MAGIYVPPDLQETEYLVGAHEERGGNRAIRHDYGPSVPVEKIDHLSGCIAIGQRAQGSVSLAKPGKGRRR